MGNHTPGNRQRLNGPQEKMTERSAAAIAVPELTLKHKHKHWLRVQRWPRLGSETIANAVLCNAMLCNDRPNERIGEHNTRNKWPKLQFVRRESQEWQHYFRWQTSDGRESWDQDWDQGWDQSYDQNKLKMKCFLIDISFYYYYSSQMERKVKSKVINSIFHIIKQTYNHWHCIWRP